MHRRRFFALKPTLVASALFSCMLTAVAIVPDTMIFPAETMMIESLPNPQIVALSLNQHSFWREEPVRSGDSLSRLLTRLGVEDKALMSFIRSDPVASRLIGLIKPNRYIRVETDSEGQLLSLHYPVNGDAEIFVERKDGKLVASEQAIALEKRLHFASGTVKSSLLAATDAAGIPEAVAFQMAEILGTNVDFLRDLRKGDRFSVVFEAEYNNGRPAGAGRIVALEFTNRGKTYQAIHFADGNEGGGYYTPDFKPLKSKASFLRSPLEFSRISSGFSMRVHPVSGEYRNHNGVDFAAPTGTKIRSTADGVVSFAGWQNGYGNIVIVKHANGFETRYGHMSRFVEGIRTGVKVTQGQYIGHVGSTGLSTGPHLHYEVRKSGGAVNPFDKNIVLALDNGAQAKMEKAFMAAKEPLMASLLAAKEIKPVEFE